MPGSGVMEEEVTKFLALERTKAKRQCGEPHHADSQWYSARKLALTVMLVAMRLRKSESVLPAEIWLMKILDFTAIYYRPFVPNFAFDPQRTLTFTLEQFKYLGLHKRGLSNPPALMLEDAQESGQEEGVGQEAEQAAAHQPAYLDLEVNDDLRVKCTIRVNDAGIVLQDASLFDSNGKLTAEQVRARAIRGLTVPISQGITTIGQQAFYNASWLGRIIIPGSVTEIGWCAFKDCQCLTELVIPDNVTRIGSQAFNGCSSLTNLSISPNVIEIGESAFDKCSGLTKLTIPERVTKIADGAFNECTNLTKVIIPPSVIEIGVGAFVLCTSLTELNIPDSLATIGMGAFAECISLTKLSIPDSVTNIDQWAFMDCSGLTEVVIGKGVTEIGKGAFNDCSGLTSLTVSDDLYDEINENRAGYGLSKALTINGVTPASSCALM